MEIKNKKASFNYFVESTIEAGIVLVGSEIKSVKNGSVNLTDSYIRIKDNEAYVINLFIDKYDGANIFNHEPTRERKLLLHKKEIKKLYEQVKTDGVTLIPLSIYLKKGLCKISIGVCRGKKLYDKRESIKKRDLERENKKWR